MYSSIFLHNYLHLQLLLLLFFFYLLLYKAQGFFNARIYLYIPTFIGIY